MKRFYLVMLLAIIVSNADAQYFDWAVKGGSWAYDYGYGVSNDQSGNVYVAGKFEDSGIFNGDTLLTAGNHDMFLAKYAPNGSLTWIRRAGGPMGDYAHALACDGVNYVYVAGEVEYAAQPITFQGSIMTLTASGDNDAFVAKYDLDGNLVWAESEGGGSNDRARAVTYDAAGNVYIAGMFTDTAWFGNTPIYGAGLRDIFVAKYDANGHLQWVRTAGSTGRDEAHGVKCDAAGNVYVCGFYSNGASFGNGPLIAPNNYFEAFLAKYDPVGNLQWVRTAGGNFDEVAWALTLDNQEKIYITGEFNASAMFGTTQLITSGNADVFIACYDTDGNIQWAKGTGGPLIDRARGIGTDGNNIYITGQFGANAAFGGTTLYAADSSDVFVAALTNNGSFLWAASAGGVQDSLETLGYESGNAVCADGTGNVYATGAFITSAQFGATSLLGWSRTDMFLAKLNDFALVHESSANYNKAKVYPNPANGNITIELKDLPAGDLDLSLYNTLGQEIKNATLKPVMIHNFDLSAIERGVYFIEVKDKTGILYRGKLVVN